MNLVKDKFGKEFYLRKLVESDSGNLGSYFENLSDVTKNSFQPHALNCKYAIFLCHRNSDTAERFVLVDFKNNIQGYFILEFGQIEHEAERYKKYGIILNHDETVYFAPSISDKHQGSQLASSVMPFFINRIKNKGIMQMVLLGGTQETNILAQNFYLKFGFKKVGGYQTEVWNVDMVLYI
ncbi:MAG: GNAT family N-acetyltransferase [Salinivirgaceae bacterium]|nr:GNAT family N-acetyltransferase [Salinivirgaceae bacterium]